MGFDPVSLATLSPRRVDASSSGARAEPFTNSKTVHSTGKKHNCRDSVDNQSILGLISLCFLGVFRDSLLMVPLGKAGLFHCMDRKSEGIESSFEKKHALRGGGPNNNTIT